MAQEKTQAGNNAVKVFLLKQMEVNRAEVSITQQFSRVN